MSTDLWSRSFLWHREELYFTKQFLPKSLCWCFPGFTFQHAISFICRWYLPVYMELLGRQNWYFGQQHKLLYWEVQRWKWNMCSGRSGGWRPVCCIYNQVSLSFMVRIPF
jgi:hypothetical protein